MAKHQLTAAQAKSFAEGYNAMVKTFKAGLSDGGKSGGYRAASWAALGYEAARGVHLKCQLANVAFKAQFITVKGAQAAFEAAY